MKRALILAVVVAVAFGLPIVAYSRDGTIPIDLTFTTDKEGEGNGMIIGTFGGVPVTGTFTGTEDSGGWILTVDRQLFASGTYTCGDGGCVFTATMLMGRSTNFDFTTSGLNGTFTGDLRGLFRNHGGWVSTVARWSNTNLAPGRIGKIVSSAARLQSGAKVQGAATKVQGNGAKVEGNGAKVKGSGTKIQGAQHARVGKTGGRIETRGQSNNARARGHGRAGQAKETDNKGRGNDSGTGQGNGAGHGNGGGQGNGNGGANGNAGGNGSDGGNGNGGRNGRE